MRLFTAVGASTVGLVPSYFFVVLRPKRILVYTWQKRFSTTVGKLIFFSGVDQTQTSLDIQ